MSNIVDMLTWILTLILDSHLPLFLAPLLTFAFGGLGIAVAYGHTSSRSMESRSEARWIRIKGAIMSLIGFVSLFILYIVPLSVTIDPYMQVVTAAIVAFKESTTDLQGNNLVWVVGVWVGSIDILRRATGSYRKKTPRTVDRMLKWTFWGLIVSAIAISVLVATWKAAQAAFPNLHLP